MTTRASAIREAGSLYISLMERMESFREGYERTQDAVHLVNLRGDSQIRQAIVSFNASSRAELLQFLTELNQLEPNITEANEFENVGEDHDIELLGQNITNLELRTLQNDLLHTSPNALGNHDDRNRDSCMRCVICLEQFDFANEIPFRLHECSHMVGKQCLNSWINGTNAQSNSCPVCRNTLCERRPRRPIDPMSRLPPSQVEHINLLRDYVDRAIYRLERILQFVTEIDGMQGVMSYCADFEAINDELRQRQIRFQIWPTMTNDNDNWKLAFEIDRVAWEVDGSLSVLSENYGDNARRIEARNRERQEGAADRQFRDIIWNQMASRQQ
ncbi:hypothetical protein BDV96DRAFT_654773 [Lophiotrema nucula]|uniref:RING-type domain-containing protein n=1 Tax=Lophiotrema nucula TaxID=690887 RepID=A0A6A5YJ73_9PLEO|nr:hypothetical protein BDV96DRAFT_654773 [Lophiotrema nucula]